MRTVGAAELRDGRPVRLIGALQDVTAQKLIEVQLRESSQRFAIAADSAGIGVWELDAVEKRLRWDDWMYRIYGIARTQPVATYRAWLNTLHREDRPRVVAQIRAAFRGSGSFDSEFRIIRPDGEVRYVKAASRVVRDPDLPGLRMTGVNFDITEARLSEIDARRETESLLGAVFDAASVSIIATDENLAIKIFSAGAERLLGYSSREMVGMETLTRILALPESASHTEGIGGDGHRRNPGEPIVEPPNLSHPHERIYVRKDGSRITVSLCVTPMRSEGNAIIGYVCVAHDITQAKRDQLALLDAKTRAERANDAKSLFLANMSHEIRTPMNAVIGLSHLMGRTSLTTEQSGFLGKIQTASNSLLSIITNILDLSKIEAGELLVDSALFSLTDLLSEVAAVIAVHAEAKGIDFRMDAPDTLSEAFIGDATRLKQILTNLLSNAVRFTHSGSVRFTIRQRADGAAGATLSFAVTDTGIGIAPEAQAKLFAPFAQADASITRRYGGTGLGLSIVKQLCKVLGGTVDCESVVGVGSTFTVVLTLLPAAQNELAAARQATIVYGQGALQGVRALVVDDSDINLEVAKRILELDGVHVSLATNGQAAFDRLQEDPTAFDVVFMDVQMPVLDGYEATRRIRSELGLPKLPIIAVTAGALSSERNRAEESGMNDFICKPFDAQSLARSIVRYVRPANRRRPSASPAPFEPPPVGVPWPDIDGIDSADARARWCGDAPLFISMLERLFEEFTAVDMPSDTEDLQAVSAHVRRLHKLRGSACTLGAKAVWGLAGEVEAACLAGDFRLAGELTIRLAAELRRLHESARRAWMGARADADAASPACDAEVPGRAVRNAKPHAIRA